MTTNDAPENPPQASAPPTGAAPAASKETLLIVDDEVSVLNFVSYVLKKEGYEVLTAEGGYAAYQLLEKRHESMGHPKIHMAIIDWSMPGWNGLKLLTEMRQRPYKDIAVVLMSGAITRDELVNAAKNRADAILVKPVTKETLIAKVAEVIFKYKAVFNPSG